MSKVPTFTEAGRLAKFWTEPIGSIEGDSLIIGAIEIA
jgi:hypothetical protein